MGEQDSGGNQQAAHGTGFGFGILIVLAYGRYEDSGNLW